MKVELKTLTYLLQKFSIIDDETIRDLKIRKLNIAQNQSVHTFKFIKKEASIEQTEILVYFIK